MHIVHEIERNQEGKELALRLLEEASGATEAWKAYAQGGRNAVLGARLEERLMEIIRAVVSVAQAEELDMSRIFAGCPGLCGSPKPHEPISGASSGDMPEGAVGDGLGWTDGIWDMTPVPTSADEETGQTPTLEWVAGFSDMLSSENAFWMIDSESRNVLVRGCDVIDESEVWTFGAEWNGNVARDVSFFWVSSRCRDDMASTVVLFNSAFDENAVDVMATDGKTHVVLVQGLEVDSFASVWAGIKYRFSHYERATSDEDTVVTIPAVSVGGSDMGGQFARELFRMTRASAPVLSPREVADEGDRTARAGDMAKTANWDISFNDVFCLFVYTEPFDGYDVLRDFEQVDMPDVALLLTDIKLFQCQAERLTDYDPYWGKDMIS